MSSYYINPTSLSKRNDRLNLSGKTHIPMVTKRVTKLKESKLSTLNVNGNKTTQVKQVKETKPKLVPRDRDGILSNNPSVEDEQQMHSSASVNKQLDQIELRVAIQVPSGVSSEQIASKDAINFTVQENSIRINEEMLGSYEFTFHSILSSSSTAEEVSAQIVDQMADNAQCYDSITAIFISPSKSFSEERPETLKALFENFFPLEQNMQQMQHIYFSYCLAIDHELYDLLDDTTKPILYENGQFHCTRRKTYSVEHALDLIQLGKLKQALYQTHLEKQNYTYLYEFIFESEENKKSTKLRYFYLADLHLEYAQGLCFNSSEEIKAIEACVRNRQRKKSPIQVDANALTNFLKPSFTRNKSKILFFYLLSAEESISKRSLLMLNFLQRIKIYGTEEDNYADSIIQKNQALIENLKASEEMSIYLFLLNNVSILEKELLSAHQHFNEITTNWSEHHRQLQSMSVEDRMYDVDKYTSQLLNLLTEQWTQIGNLIDSAKMFQAGLRQLKQSVNAIDTKEVANL